MFELFGPFARPTPSLLPLAFVLWPLAGVVAACFGSAVRARRVAIGVCISGAVIALAGLAASLSWPAEERFLLSHLGVAARIGQLELVVALVADPLAAILSSAAFATTAGVLIARGVSRRRTLLMCALCFGAQIVALADGPTTLLLGSGVVAAIAGVIGCVRSASFVTDRIADVATVGAAAILFWTLGGSWIDGRYVPELEARVVATAAAPGAHAARMDDDDDEHAARTTPKRGARGELGFAGLPGAAVLVDGVWLRSGTRLVQTPFDDATVAAGPHTVRVHVGGGADDYFVPRISVAENAHVQLAVHGATTTFREMQDAWMARDAGGDAATNAALSRRKFFGGGSSIAIVIGFLVVAFFARARVFPFAEPSTSDASAISSLAALAVIARYPVASFAPNAASFVTSITLLGAIAAASVAVQSRSRHALFTADLAFAAAGVLAGAPSFAVLHALTLTLANVSRTPAVMRTIVLLPTRVAILAACAALPYSAVPITLALAASLLIGATAGSALSPSRLRVMLSSLVGAVLVAVAIDPRTFGSAHEPLIVGLLGPSFRSVNATSIPSLPIVVTTLAVVTFAAVLARSNAVERLAGSPVVRVIAAVVVSRRLARSTAAMSRAVAAALMELEARVVHVATMAHNAVTSFTALVFSADDAITTALLRVRVPLPPLRFTSIALVPLALVACASFVLPWLS